MANRVPVNPNQPINPEGFSILNAAQALQQRPGRIDNQVNQAVQNQQALDLYQQAQPSQIDNNIRAKMQAQQQAQMAKQAQNMVETQALYNQAAPRKTSLLEDMVNWARQ